MSVCAPRVGDRSLRRFHLGGGGKGDGGDGDGGGGGDGGGKKGDESVGDGDDGDGGGDDGGGGGGGGARRHSYSYFIFINSSTRGPFLPSYVHALKARGWASIHTTTITAHIVYSHNHN